MLFTPVYGCHASYGSNCKTKILCRCSVCETLFNSAMELEHHKEDLHHWSDLEDEVKRCLLIYLHFLHTGSVRGSRCGNP